MKTPAVTQTTPASPAIAAESQAQRKDTIQLIVRPTKPDELETTEADAQGFAMNEYKRELNNDRYNVGGGKSTGNWYDGLVMMYKFYSNPFGTFGNALYKGTTQYGK